MPTLAQAVATYEAQLSTVVSTFTASNTTASTQATSATTSAGTATTQAAAAAISRAAIDNRIYPGTYAVAPTTRLDTTAIQNGDQYFGADGFTYVRVAGAWVNQTSAAATSAATAIAQAVTAATAQVLATAQAVVSTTGSVIASSAKASAEAARDAALIQSGVYVDEPTGRAAVADGAAFKVQGSGAVAAYEYRRVSAGSTATLIATYPSVAALESLLKPAATSTPVNIGDLTFEATSNTSLKIKFKGSDGVVRSATLAMA